MGEKEFTKKMTGFLKRVDKVMQDVELVVEAAKELKGALDGIKQRFTKPKEDG